MVDAGAWSAAAFSMVGVSFVAISLFTDVTRSTWNLVNSVTTVLGLACCGVAGFSSARATRSAWWGAAAGAVGGVVPAVIVPIATYGLAYGFLDSVHQYPFEYYDFVSSGAGTVREFLLSERGHATVLETSLGLTPVTALLGASVGGVLGLVGGSWGSRGCRSADAWPPT